MTSHDMEDLVAVLDGRPELVREIEDCPADLRSHLADSFTGLLADADFLQALPGHLPGDAASQARVDLLIQRMEQTSR